MNLTVDIGNSGTKIGLFNKNEPVQFLHFKPTASVPWKKMVAQYQINNAIICSVAKDSGKKIPKVLGTQIKTMYLSENTIVPISNNYKTPKTLGKDRLASAVGGNALFPKKNVLVIQAGTCITFDMVNAKGQYLGGAISPGLMMRFKALHTFTGKLPLVTPENINYRLGTTTQQSILSGVINGMSDEIDSAIEDYRHKYKSLKVIITGGDAYFFESQLKNEIFAKPNLVLYGLNKILEYNVKSKG